jgi:hypothetical protein
MKMRGRWGSILTTCVLLASGGCTVQQQHDVLGTIGQVIPGSSNSVFKPDSSSHDVSESQTATAEKPAPRVDPNRVDAQLVLQTLQRAMSDHAAPFLECLDNQLCRPALTGHLIRLQKQAMGTLELPPVYDRYDLKRGKE